MWDMVQAELKFNLDLVQNNSNNRKILCGFEDLGENNYGVINPRTRMT
jgi:hypothetical protein